MVRRLVGLIKNVVGVVIQRVRVWWRGGVVWCVWNWPHLYSTQLNYVWYGYVLTGDGCQLTLIRECVSQGYDMEGVDL